MNAHATMDTGALTDSRLIAAPLPLAFDAWTQLDHRRHWFVGTEWTEIERSLDFRAGGVEFAHGRFATGVETRYSALFHEIVPNARLAYTFDVRVDGVLSAVALAGVEFAAVAGGTEVTYTEQALFLAGTYNPDSRRAGTRILLGQYETHLASLCRRPN